MSAVASNGKTLTVARLRFSVYGIPVTQGSARAILHRTTQRPILIPDRSRELRSWREAVASAAVEAMRLDRVLPLDGALGMALTFRLPSPRSRPTELRTEKQKVEWARPWRRPDLSKLVRSVEDALAGVAYRDDAQIVELVTKKDYAPVAGVDVELWNIV